MRGKGLEKVYRAISTGIPVKLTKTTRKIGKISGQPHAHINYVYIWRLKLYIHARSLVRGLVLQ